MTPAEKDRIRCASPEYKAQRRAQKATPEAQAKRRELAARPEQKAKRSEWNKSARAKEWKKAWRSKPESIAKERAYEKAFRSRRREIQTSPDGRARERMKRYGITRTQAGELEKRTICDICGTVPKETLHLDHCHATGKVRGMLCRKCNFAVGLLEDSPDRMRRMVRYLDSHKQLSIAGAA